MCKIASATKITDKNRSDVWIFMQLLGQRMSPGNNSGLGYAALDKDGNIFGEKWVINESAFRDLTKIPGATSEKLAKVYGFIGNKVVQDEAQAIILHTRAATQGAICVANTHPFVDDEDSPSVAVIHNGWVHNEKLFTRKYSTCDSEVLAHLYAENKVAEDLGNLNKFIPKIDGWFTCLTLGKDSDGKMIMDAFTDNGRLSSYFIKELDTRIWSSEATDIWEIAKALGLTAVDPIKMSRNTAFRINVLTGEEVSNVKLDVSTAIPVRYETDFWEGWGSVHTMSGNLDDLAFRDKYFGNRK